MSEIGDELRELADERGVMPWELYALADRIDAEMAELPRGKDGRPIRLGDTVYGEDGRAWHVRGVTIGDMSMGAGRNILVTGDSGQWRDLLPEWLTHERPDSFERIADELDQWRKDAAADRRIGVTVEDTISDFAERIRRLAEREADR